MKAFFGTLVFFILMLVGFKLPSEFCVGATLGFALFGIICLIPTMLVRFVFFRKPLSKGASFGFTILLSFINCFYISAFRGQGPLFASFAGYWIVGMTFCTYSVLRMRKRGATDIDAFYDEVAKEIEMNKLISGVWTRAFAEADGDENRAKAIYIKLRIAQLTGIASHLKTPPQKESARNGCSNWALAVVVLAGIGIASYWMVMQGKIGSPICPSSPACPAVALCQKAKSVFEPAHSKAVSPQAGRVWTADLGSGVSMEFVPIPAGSFMMGTENGEWDDKPVHRVTLTKPFWMAKTEVTQAQYQQVTGSNPSAFKGAQNPVDQVGWNDAVEFCRKLTVLERQAGRMSEGFEYTLPTEAQWEYACRAGTSGDYAGNLDSMAWYSSNSGSQTHPVGQKQPNAWGLYDMPGNVREWCKDWYDGGTYNQGSVTDPCGASSGSARVTRGGCWYTLASPCGSANRFYSSPESANSGDLGFRPLVQQK